MNFREACEYGSIADDDTSFPGLDVLFDLRPSPSWIARRDCERDAVFERALRGHLLAD